MKKRLVLSALALSLPLSAAASAQQTSLPSAVLSATRPRTVVAPQQQQPTAAATPYSSSPKKLPPSNVAALRARPVLAPRLPEHMPVVVPHKAPPIAPDKLRARLAEALRLFKSAPVLTSASPTSTDLVTIAALDHVTSQIHLIRLSKSALLRKNAEMSMTTSQGRLVRLRTLRSNYVNTAVHIYDVATSHSLTPLLIQYPIEKGGQFREMAYYTSAHPTLLSGDLVRSGQFYVRNMLDLAAKRLKEKGVNIAPDLIDIAERLCTVEHVDHQRFLTEDRLALYEEIFALYALNEIDTYRYSVSVAGAGGMVQMIPSTYHGLRRLHPEANLHPDFVTGMRNHANALEAMLIYIDDTWAELSYNAEVAYALSAGIATKTELMAAGYNSNPMRLPSYLLRGGAAWRTLIPRETQMYLQIYKSVDGLIPMKSRKA